MKKILFTACIILSMSMQHLHSSYQYTNAYPDELSSTIDNIFYSALNTSNKWGYVWFRFPDMSSNGLMYHVHAAINLTNVKIDSFAKAENLYIEITKDLNKKINSIRAIRPFLAEFPLTPRSLIICLGFEDENEKPIPPPFFSALLNGEDHLEFKKFYKNNLTFHKVVFDKPIPEIKELNELYSVSIPRTSVTPKPNVPELKHLSWKQDCPVGQAIFNFIKRFSKQNNLHIITIGTVGEHYFDSRVFDFALRGQQTLSLNVAKNLAALCAQQSLQCAQTDKRCTEFMYERGHDPRYRDAATIAEPRHIAFRISFWDENVDRVPEPYIAEIRVIGENFQYFTADEGQRLQLVHEETFAEAMASLKK